MKREKKRCSKYICKRIRQEAGKNGDPTIYECHAGIWNASAPSQYVILERNAGDICRESASGEYVEITISDTGLGIPPEIIDRVFDPYFTTKEVGKGSGMGLSVAHGIIESHGGVINVDSRPGKRCAFSVFLPVTDGKVSI